MTGSVRERVQHDVVPGVRWIDRDADDRDTYGSRCAVPSAPGAGGPLPGGSTVAIVAFTGARLLDLAVPLEVFAADRTGAGHPVHRVEVVAGDDGAHEALGMLVAAGGVEDVIARADLVVVPWWRPDTGPAPRSVLDGLRAAHARGATVAGSCRGVFVLAEAGLLRGRRATTHWMHTAELSQRHPDIRVDHEALFVDEGTVLTAAGNMASVDLCLHLLRRLRGAAAAGDVARRMVMPPPRSGGDAQVLEVPVSGDEPDDRMPRALRWALENLSSPIEVDQWAATAYMSPRTFARRFRAEVGRTPHQWLLHQRVLLAQQLLERTDLTIDRITDATGFGSPIALRTHFRRALGCSPTQYRAGFRARVSAGEASPRTAAT
ncbi:Transcriptional regulator GlxA family, contains an amidase domain and an AraC-type DNA-binding HTH domain [Blastococcus sp. DSM 46786]|uniref:GlxA family transcriptional regulator n=1 Tax=Blastococcus sp. DSM 46786 TaxID=1798227 RepID=UPI0008ABC30B|nr:helix-turn-helix domain-containing protein [Blastococcus sp. DSM 46786]SEM05792.1 Transcriptional regulator GlxA family, contains an amidase domain and an AraC-type DNA-binding HTH domain [Blastococcus sp. DSM 46786]